MASSLWLPGAIARFPLAFGRSKVLLAGWPRICAALTVQLCCLRWLYDANLHHPWSIAVLCRLVQRREQQSRAHHCARAR